MISVTKLLCDTEYFGDSLRYSQDSQGQVHGTTAGHGPVVVWNCTRTCNLKCRHCYSNSEAKDYEGELTTGEALRFIDSLAEFKVPVLLFSGGEPLLRKDLLQLASYAASKGIRPTISTNGTLLEPDTVNFLKNIGVGYVGVSLDGIGENNDRFRGRRGAFNAALKGIRNCIAAGQRVGLRFTINRNNYKDLNDIFDLVEQEDIPRVCFYHLVYAGRGSKMVEEDVTRQEARAALDLIMDRTLDFYRRGLKKEILTVDNHADGVYIYLKLKKTEPVRAEQALKLLRLNGGNRTGVAIGAVDWYGNVHPDQFTQNHTFGNVKERKFGDIWTDAGQPILAGLKNRRSLLKGRCAQCRWLDICNGNFRARAEAVTGDFWEYDPACYLTAEEIGQKN
ncbi:Antilisterial bacteriocin subtilosin biosynthesis protein AlbA [Pelotomaculum schinkii]|uniref:Mycofactocin maturase MftC n=1 Tax=Pelotomaculum schinkii TaxID=78350 RepID=A0A4Y7RDF2_9FIRM|nr:MULTISPECIES: putative heme d1 biosynthesis radical SAM protein NirJ1 [Pelotomaculum]TEB07024.1 Antilisterial bacteriocin subtilosin biosynthesis protein AlbA [Pelotomaculum schinkii]TEB16937.1 Antilisterial bacteriocin subtilosin biosynthesis protein AlbA [Pelotomaculum sp. FP]